MKYIKVQYIREKYLSDSVSLRRQKTLDFSVPPEKLKVELRIQRIIDLVQKVIKVLHFQEQLRKTQEENEQSKLYIDKVLSQIMDHCSDLLEIKK